MEEANCRHAQRRAVHSTGIDGDDLDARRTRRIELGQRRRRIPAKGLMYLNTQDWPTIYKLSLEDPLAKPRRAIPVAEGSSISKVPGVSWRKWCARPDPVHHRSPQSASVCRIGFVPPVGP